LEKEIALDANNRYSTSGATAWNNSYLTLESSADWRGEQAQKMRSTTTGAGDMAGTSNAYNAIDNTKRGFDALLAGAGDNFDIYGYFWSTSSRSKETAWRRSVEKNHKGAIRYSSNKAYGFSVRCKKN
jgi:uncharacterized protein (TIGR02145 family)